MNGSKIRQKDDGYMVGKAEANSIVPILVR
jgi:hypothetical protein